MMHYGPMSEIDIKSRFDMFRMARSIVCPAFSRRSVPNEKTPESGERLECQGFYSSQKIKMSIGLECEVGTIGGIRASDGYDYDADYLDNGMAYIILPETKTEQYVFGIVRIDRVGWDDPIDDEHHRDVRTWFAADPTYGL